MSKNNRAPSAAEIEAFLKAKADKEAAEKAAEKKAGKDTKYPGLAFHICTVIGGRKYDEGTEVKCLWVGLNKFKQDTAKIVFKDGTEGWINPKFLKGGKAMNEAEVARIQAEREKEADETVLVPASVGQERDKSVLLNYTGWFAGAWFPKSMVEKVGETKDGLGVFEVPAWKVRKDKGPDSLSALRAKQDDIKASIVE